MTAAPQWLPVDEQTGSLLDLLADDGAPILSPAEEWSAFTATLRFVARHHGGVVSANVMRELVRGVVKPCRVGPMYRRACREGLIRVDGWEVSTDTAGKNSGKPAKRYVWVSAVDGRNFLDATREPHGLGRRPEPEFVPDVAAIEAWQRRQERTRVAYAAHLVFVAREDAHEAAADAYEDREAGR